MQSIKIVTGFFSKTTAMSERAHQRRLAKASNKKIAIIKTVDACTVYDSNTFFRSKIKKFGNPVPGQLVIIIYYKELTVKVAKIKKPKPIDMIEPAQNVIPLRAPKMVNLKVSEKSAKARTILIKLYTKNNSNLIKKTGRTFEFRPLHNLELRA